MHRGMLPEANRIVSTLLRSALGVLLAAACCGLALFAALHGVVWLALIAILVAALFAWAVEDNRRLMRMRALRDASAGDQRVSAGDPDSVDDGGAPALR